MARTLDLRTYLLLERAFVRRLQRSWKQQSAPTYAAIAQACTDHEWDKARRLVSDLDMTEVGTENREWITYMLMSCAVFGAGMVAKGKPTFVGTGSFDTFLKHVTNNMLQYLEHGATAQVQAEALQSIAEDEAKTKAIKFDPRITKFDEAKHPRDNAGRFTESIGVTIEGGYTGGMEATDIEGAGPVRKRWRERNKEAMEAADAYFDANREHKVFVDAAITQIAKLGENASPEALAALEQQIYNEPAYVRSSQRLRRAEAIMNETEAALKAIEPAMRKEVVTNLAHSVAEKMGIDRSIIHVVDKEPSTFKVGGEQFTEAGHYQPGTGQIEINSRQIPYGDAPAVKGIVAHEISHHIYHTIKKAAQKEFDRYLDQAVNPGGQSHTEWYQERFEMVGDVKREMRLKPEYRAEFAENYPASAAMMALGGDFFRGISKEMVAEDGHSAYAKSYWAKEALAPGAGRGYGDAINETIAEVTRWIEAPRSWHEPTLPTRSWMLLTQAMHEWYRKQHPA